MTRLYRRKFTEDHTIRKSKQKHAKEGKDEIIDE